jgi:hypothetical protein
VTVTVTGCNPLVVRATSSVTIAGTLSLTGATGDAGDAAGGGGGGAGGGSVGGAESSRWVTLRALAG